MVDVSIRRDPVNDPIPDVYRSLGVTPIINARGATTAIGGSLMPPEVLEAMQSASTRFVVLDDLNARIGQQIASATGAEAGYVTSGSAAGLTLAAAACITGTDLASVRALPATDGRPNQIVVHRAHRIRYDQMFRVAGAEIVEIGFHQSTEPWELEAALNERTAAVAFHVSPAVGPNALEFATVVEIAHRHSVPVIVDAASTLPPVDHLRRWIRWGADLVIYSGGKGIRGPQDSGLLAGRADLIDAAALNGAPNVGIGRGMKVSKEAMVGLSVALDLFLNHDHEADFAVRVKQAGFIREQLLDVGDTRFELIGDWERFPAPVLVVHPDPRIVKPLELRDSLIAGTPSIHANLELGGLSIHTHCLVPGEEIEIARRLTQLLNSP